jgi:hypothetical protein
MGVSGGLSGDDELHAELLGALGQMMQHACTVALFVVVLPLVSVRVSERVNFEIKVGMK